MSVQLTSHGVNSPLWRAASNVLNGGGSPPAAPPPPPPPDYAAANRSGVLADIASLATRKSIENAAIYGGTVKNYGVTESNGKYYQKYNEDGKAYASPVEISKEEAFSTFTPENSTIGASEKMADWQRSSLDKNAQFGLDLTAKYGDKYIAQAKDLMEKLDPEGTANRKELADAVNNQLETIAGDGPALEEIKAAGGMEKIVDAASQERVADIDSLKRGSANDGGGNTQAVRSQLEQDILDNLKSGEDLTPNQIKRIEEQTRSAQIARGNSSGNAASAAEIAAKYDFGTRIGQQRRGEAMGLLTSGQSTFDTANRLRQEDNALTQQDLQNKLVTTSQRNSSAQIDYSNLLGAVSQRNTATQQDYANAVTQNQANNQIRQQGFANQLTSIGQRNAAEQQRIANMSSYAGLAPVGAIASQTQGAQATPVWTGQPAQMMNLLNVNGNAGNDAAKFALGVFDTQSRNYSSLLNYNASTYATQQQYNSPMSWVNTIGGVIGNVGKLY
jgi:hypothetical protein